MKSWGHASNGRGERKKEREGGREENLKINK
jgi:hypothetical protein